MAKKYEDDELEKLIDESFTEEELMEEGLLSGEEDDFGPYDPSEEEIRASYQELVARLKREGVYREERKKQSPWRRFPKRRKERDFMAASWQRWPEWHWYVVRVCLLPA